MIDLVMWTLNSEKTLNPCLKSINKAIPSSVVNQKIIIDGHSQDSTSKIAKKWGWTFIEADKVGIPFQANQALNLVETECFASFEHDIIVHPSWFNKMSAHFSDKKVAVAQGIRLATHPTFRAIDTYEMNHLNQKSFASLDNTMFNTKAVKMAGGFDTKYSLSTDRALQQKLRSQGYKWIIDKSVVSDHLRPDVYGSLKHSYGLWITSKYFTSSIRRNTARMLFSPLRGLEIALKHKQPSVVYMYPLIRLLSVKASIRRNGCKR